MRCLARLGCLVVLVIVGAVAWFTRDTWMSKLRRAPAADTTVAAAEVWQRVTPDGGARARDALRRLQARNGPAFVNVTPADLASYILQELRQTLPASADSIEASAIGDRLYVRTTIRTADLGAKEILGPMAALLGDRERVQLGGVVRIIRPGFGELQVKEFRIRDFAVPRALIPRMIRQITRGERPPELSPDGLPLQTPPYIGDVRVTDGRITLYKAQ
jgi:hypothetical protein